MAVGENEGNGLPHQSADWFAMTATLGVVYNDGDEGARIAAPV